MAETVQDPQASSSPAAPSAAPSSAEPSAAGSSGSPRPWTESDDRNLRTGRFDAWWPFIASSALTFGMWLWGFVALPGIPADLPLRIGPEGETTTWEEATFGSVFLGPIVLTAMLVGVLVLSRLLHTLIPERRGLSGWKRFQREAALRGIVGGLGWATLLMVGLLGTASANMWATASVFPWWAFPLGMTVFLVLLLPALALPTCRWRRWAGNAARSTGHLPTPEEEDEDRLWGPLGVKLDGEDPRAIVPKRDVHGIGTTVNLGSARGRAVGVLFLLLMVVFPLTTIWISSMP